MGAYLSSPVTDKISSDGSCTSFTYGASSMQGWRISQEDAHNCIPELDSETSLFAVYDGHGGAEVAQYCAKYLPDCIKETEQYKDGELGPALVDAFLKFDSMLVQEEVIKELKLLAGVDENDEEEDDDDPVARGEADDLRAEADLPLDELLAKYQTPPSAAAARNLRKKENYQSPVIQSKQQSRIGPGDGPSSSGDAGVGAGSSQASSSSSVSPGLTNGVADNENNLNKEKELRGSTSSSEQAAVDGSGDSNCANSVDKVSSSSASSAGDNKESSLSVNSAGGSGLGNAGQSSINCADSTSSREGDSGRCSSTSSSTGDSGGSGSNAVSASGSSAQPSSGSASASDGVSSSTSEVEEGGSSGNASGGSKIANDGEEGGSGSGSSGSKGLKNGKKTEEHMDDEDDSDDDDDEDDEDEWQDLSGEEEDEDEDEEEGMDGTDDPMMDMSNEEPGSDSGCTACVALMRGDHLVVANAGDSRCVLCRGGSALDLSVDHKPEDDIEQSRIEKAGGKVTPDGRVNGGLNLSRAIGDHFYKRKEDLPAEQQMITALPDIQTVAIVPEDQFLVLACDGIWNSMSSQECVDFIAERLKDPNKKSKPSLICEELFEHCLAANTYGDGTGCDNMTCIIVLLNQPGQTSADGSSLAPSKRCVGDVETPEENSEKRPRVEEGEAGSTSG